MNKRSAMGAKSSDTNDRTEPLVGAAVVYEIYKNSLGTTREPTMQWVVELLYPTLLEWNQWAWRLRRWVHWPAVRNLFTHTVAKSRSVVDQVQCGEGCSARWPASSGS